MPYKNLNEFIERLESKGLLKRVSQFVDPHLEMTEIADRMAKSDGMALLFENNGTEFPVLMNAFASDERMCLSLGIENMDQPGKEMEALLKKISGPKGGLKDKLGLLGTLQSVSSWMPGKVKGKADCQQVVMENPDLNRLPVLTCWPHDGGPFITLPVVHTVDAVTGSKNAGMYRMQVFGPQLCGMHWHLHKDSAKHFRGYKALGQRMPVSVTLGGDPAYTYAATAPLPAQIEEMMLAGFLRKKKVELVKCLTNDLEVPADVDFVIEGYVDPMEELILEGPFGDHTGYYSLADFYPRFHVTCITHRKNAVYPATIVGIPPMEDAWLGKATERIFLFPIRMSMLPEMVDMHMPAEGVFHNIVLLSIKKDYAGQASKVMNALWGAGQMMFNKVMIVLDEDCDLHNYSQVLNKIAENVAVGNDIYYSRGPADVLDHSSQDFAFGGKMGLDATKKEGMELPYSPVNPEDFKELFFGDESVTIKSPIDTIPLLLVFLKKHDSQQIRKLHEKLCAVKEAETIKFVVYCDFECRNLTTRELIWLAANHIDPSRDCFSYCNASGLNSLGIDATVKIQGKDGFKREWPNPVVMDEATVSTIDLKWDELGLGEFVSSPSAKYLGLVRGKGAVAGE